MIVATTIFVAAIVVDDFLLQRRYRQRLRGIPIGFFTATLKWVWAPRQSSKWERDGLPFEYFWQKWVLLPYPLRFAAFGNNYQVARIYLPWSRLFALLTPLDSLFFAVAVFAFMLATLVLQIISVAYGTTVEPVGIGLPGPDSRRR